VSAKAYEKNSALLSNLFTFASHFHKRKGPIAQLVRAPDS
jgi:hypothetical protein